MTDTLPAAPSTQSLVMYSPRLDSYRRYLTDAPEPAKLAGYLKAADNGDIAAIIELQEEMEGKDAHINSIAATRRGAISGLEWEIEAQQVPSGQDRADEIASYCKDRLNDLDDFDGILSHLNLGIGPNFACAELIWENRELVDAVPVLGDRLIRNLRLSDQVYVVTDSAPRGLEMPPGKFVLYQPDILTSRSVRVSLTRATLFLWMLKKFTVDGWGEFVEIYGQPFRFAKYTPSGDEQTTSATDKERTELRSMLRNLGRDGWGIFSGNVEIEWVSHAVTEGPHEKLAEWCDRKLTILWKGATLTTDVTNTGAYSASKTHEAVEKRIMVSDMKAESKCLRSQLLRPMVVYKFGHDAPVPYFKRVIKEQVDTAEAEIQLKRLSYADDHKIDLDIETKYQALGFPKPKKKAKAEDDPKVVTFNELTLGLERAASVGDLDLVNVLREEIFIFLSKPIAPLAELPDANPAPMEPQAVQGEDTDEDNQEVAASIRGDVLKVVARQFLTIDEVTASLKHYTREQVRGVLHSPEIQPLLGKKRKGRDTAYRIKPTILNAII